MYPKLTGYIKGTVHIFSVICIFLATWIHLSVCRRPPASVEHLIAGLEPSVFLVNEFIDKTDLKLECVIYVWSARYSYLKVPFFTPPINKSDGSVHVLLTSIRHQ